ncbi:hypothetical protein Tco_0572989 [Tanacetum coccineum]
MRYTTSTLFYQKNWISLNPTTPRGVTSSKAIVVTLVSSNTSKAQAHSRPHPHLSRTIGSQPIPLTRVVALKVELRMIQMGDQTADEYFLNIDSIVTLLNDLGSDVSHYDVVTYAINGLRDKYGSLAQIIAHKESFPDLSTVRSMVSTEEMRIRNKPMSVKTLVEVFVVGVPPAGTYMIRLVPQALFTNAQDPANANWHMDTSASSHLNSSAHNISTIFNSRMYPSVLVGDGKSIPVTNTGHSTLPTPYRPLHLNSVLVTP